MLNDSRRKPDSSGSRHHAHRIVVNNHGRQCECWHAHGNERGSGTVSLTNAPAPNGAIKCGYSHGTKQCGCEARTVGEVNAHGIGYLADSGRESEVEGRVEGVVIFAFERPVGNGTLCDLIARWRGLPANISIHAPTRPRLKGVRAQIVALDGQFPDRDPVGVVNVRPFTNVGQGGGR